MNEMILAERILRMTQAERKTVNRAIKSLMTVGYTFPNAMLLVLDGPRFQLRSGEGKRSKEFWMQEAR